MTAPEQPETIPEPTEEDRSRSVSVRLQVLDERLGRQIDEILNLLSEDLPRYLHREVKGRFLADPEWASQQSDGRVREIKDAVTGAGREATASIAEALRERSLWLDLGDDHPGWGARLEDNRRVWTHIARAEAWVRDLLEQFEFPDRNFNPYRVPTWLTTGRLLRQAIDGYWRDVNELWALQDHRRNRERHAHVDQLADRWDAVGRS